MNQNAGSHAVHKQTLSLCSVLIVVPRTQPLGGGGCRPGHAGQEAGGLAGVSVSGG